MGDRAPSERRGKGRWIMQVTLRDTITTKAGLRPYKGAPESKTVTLKINIANLTAAQIEEALAAKFRITWQNTSRDKYDKIKDGAVIDYTPYVKTSTVRPMTLDEMVDYVEHHPEDTQAVANLKHVLELIERQQNKQ